MQASATPSSASSTQSPSMRGMPTVRMPAPIAATVSCRDVTIATHLGGLGSRPNAKPGARPKPSEPPKPSGLSTHSDRRSAVTSATCGSLPLSRQQGASSRNARSGSFSSIGRSAGSRSATSVLASFASPISRRTPLRTAPVDASSAASRVKMMSSQRSKFRSMRAAPQRTTGLAVVRRSCSGTTSDNGSRVRIITRRLAAGLADELRARFEQFARLVGDGGGLAEGEQG